MKVLLILRRLYRFVSCDNKVSAGVKNCLYIYICIYIYMAEENKSGLINKINLLSTQLNIHKQSVNFKNPSTFLSKAENTLSKHLKNHQLNLIRTNKKLKFYSIFKNETNHSEFINHIRNPEHRRVASKFRIGNHNLKIETGRFTKCPLNVSGRFTKCPLNVSKAMTNCKK